MREGPSPKARKSRGRIRQRHAAGDGRPALWEGRFSVVDAAAPAGRRWLSVYGRTRAEAETKLSEAMSSRARGVIAPRGASTLGTYLSAWLDRVEPRLKPSTALRYRGLVEHHITPTLGGIRLAALTPTHVDTLMSAVMASGRGAQTANHARAVLRTALNDAVRDSLTVRNVASLTDPRRVEPHQVPPMQPEDATAILAAVAGLPLRPIVTTALWTGLRMGELLALTWDRVDLDRGQLVVSSSIVRVARQTKVAGTKTRGSVRAVPIAEPLRDILLAHRAAQRELRLAAGAQWDSSWGDLVFCSVNGSPLIGTSVNSAFRKVLARAGLPHRRFHDLRHGAATLWLAAGVDLKTVSSLLGHSNISTTAHIYTSVLDTLKADAAQRMTRLLGAGPRRAPAPPFG